MGARIAGIQPGYLPWLGYFDQMLDVDAFVIADEMPWTSSGWAHRNRVLGANGVAWLRLPVRPGGGQRIDQVRLDVRVPWVRTHLRTLRQSYARSPFAGEELDLLEPLLDQAATRLVDVDVPLLRHLARRLGITTPLLVSSELGLEAAYVRRYPDRPGPTHRIVAFMEELGADQLLEGAAGRAYLDLELCRRHGIAVEFHDYRHPVYPQRPGAFVSHLSVVDLLCNVGPDSALRALRGG